ncbi:MAG TPA: hypothetical protein VHS81_09415 [Caulobacteraceae bacterium]|nr:hypothetical protein [Caulobacteraceae bacterium]
MSKYLPRVLIGLVVGVATYILMAAVDGSSPLAVIAGVSGVVATVYILTALAGNRKVSVAGADAKAKALELSPPTGKALLVVAREGLVAKLVGLNMALDGDVFAQLKSPAFSILEIAPGSHTLTCGTGASAAQGKPASYAFSAEAGAVVGVVVGVSVVTGYKFSPANDVATLRRRLAGVPMVLAGS